MPSGSIASPPTFPLAPSGSGLHVTSFTLRTVPDQHGSIWRVLTSNLNHARSTKNYKASRWHISRKGSGISAVTLYVRYNMDMLNKYTLEAACPQSLRLAAVVPTPHTPDAKVEIGIVVGRSRQAEEYRANPGRVVYHEGATRWVDITRSPTLFIFVVNESGNGEISRIRSES